MQLLLTNFFLNHVLFPKSAAMRITVHACFWICFTVGHILFFLPNMLRGTLSAPVVYSYILYYGKFLFIFYTCLLLSRLLRRRLGSFFTIPLLFPASLVITYLFNLIIFKIAAQLIGLENTTLNFEMLGNAFLQTANSDWIAKVSLLIFNLQDMQLLILPVGIKMVKFGMKYQNKLQDIETQRLKNELHQLRSQLSPHFILNIISALSVQLKIVSKESADYLARLTDLIHYSLYETSQDMVALEREIHCFKTLIDLESGRKHSRLMLSIEQTGTVRPTHRIPVLILMTLAENAFKHGARSDLSPSVLNVTIAVNRNQLDFFIENSKADKPGLIQDKPSGMGLKNIIRRLQLHFNDDFTFTVNETQQLFSVRLIIPIIGTDPLKPFQT
jgi:two-component system LytT family sensor kinase